VLCATFSLGFRKDVVRVDLILESRHERIASRLADSL
jgi:hypothetical protein